MPENVRTVTIPQLADALDISVTRLNLALQRAERVGQAGHSYLYEMESAKQSMSHYFKRAYEHNLSEARRYKLILEIIRDM